jgi:WS/DGAT/MGAT family acyltransferase
MVPVSIRTGGDGTGDTYQNRVSGLLSNLATNEPDPVKRLRLVQQSMTAAKGSFAAIPAETLQDYTQFAPPAIAARAMRMYSRLRIADRMNPPFNVTISNVPGPAEPLYSAGARLEHFYPVSMIIDGQGLNMTVQSYNGNLDFGFIACRELVPDLWSLVDFLHESLDELLDSIGTSTPTPTTTTAAAKKAAKRPAKAAAKKAARRPAKATAKKAAKRPAKKATKKVATARTRAPVKRAASR